MYICICIFIRITLSSSKLHCIQIREINSKDAHKRGCVFLEDLPYAMHNVVLYERFQRMVNGCLLVPFSGLQ